MTQQQWTYTSRGLPWDVLSKTSAPLPTLPPPVPFPKDVPEPEEWILVKVAFTALNSGAIFQMTLIPPYVRSRVAVPEMDLSGTVLDVWHPDATADPGKPHTRFSKGDKVVAMLPAAHTIPTGNGALAEYVRLPARYAVPKPEGIGFADAAGVMLAGLTARQLVMESGVTTGDRVLVNAASGGIGHLVIQMLRNTVGSDGFIVAICGASKADMMKSLGADEVIDYTAHTDLPRHLCLRFGNAPFHAVIDVRGHQALYKASPGFLAPNGIYESVGIKPPTFFVPDFLRAVLVMKANEYWPTSPWLGGVGRRWGACAMMSPTLEDREEVVAILGSGKIRIVRDSVWSFDHVKEAYERLAEGHAGGKVLVKVDASIDDDDS